MHKIVVTGGAGRLARYVIDELLAHGFSVLAVDSVRPEKLRCLAISAGPGLPRW
ncbi:MAG: NAD(P)-dependent oxidoreductase [Planctomycetaceae bacterium]|nr:NAD(P)-dependent oxidoreductase [Planctomycetaceae bacterium]